MRRLADLSIRAKLALLIVGVSVTGIAASSIFLIVASYQSFYDQKVELVATAMDLAAEFLTAPLMFCDMDGATETLTKLAYEAKIYHAIVYDDSNKPFATYWEDAQIDQVESFDMASLLGLQPNEHLIENSWLLMRRDVTYRGELRGVLFAAASLHPVQQEIRSFLGYTTGVLLLILLGVFFLAALLQRSISQPIIELAESFRVLSTEADYSLRVSHEEKNEIGMLYREFNELLTQLQLRRQQFFDAQEELQQLNARLENTVRERTEQLQLTNDELEAFTYSVSHDLQAPLRHMDGFLSLFRQNHTGEWNTNEQHYLTRLDEVIQNMKELIQGLLALSRSNQAKLNKEVIDMNTFVGDIIHRLETEVGEREVEWDVQNLEPVTGDAVLLRQVFENLFLNALKFSRTKPRSVISVTGRPIENNLYRITVADNGVGFDQQYKDKLFTAFQRLHSESEFEGVGIGLATTKRIVTRHGGRISAESVEGEGASFIVDLPMNMES